jgi:hypothetical protein
MYKDKKVLQKYDINWWYYDYKGATKIRY